MTAATSSTRTITTTALHHYAGLNWGSSITGHDTMPISNESKAGVGAKQYSPRERTSGEGSAMSNDESAFSEGARAASRELGRVNIAVLGNTGVGKSTLINAVFGDTFADDRRPSADVGGPVTLSIEYFTNRAQTLGIYDFPGIETGDHVKELVKFFQRNLKRNRGGDSAELITMVWYCVNANSRRFDKGQEDFIRGVAKLGVPILLVVTQAAKSAAGDIDPDARKLAEYIESLDLPVEEEPILLCARPSAYSMVHGLEGLLDATFRAAPEALRAAVTAAQDLDYARKAIEARKFIGVAVAATASAGAIPLPGSDAAMIVPAQALMMAKVAAVYGLPLARSTAVSVSATVAATQVGRLAVGAALKLVPGLGSVVNATVAAAITGAIGEAWRVVCECIARGELSVDILDNAAELAGVFLEQFRGQLRDQGLASTSSSSQASI